LATSSRKRVCFHISRSSGISYTALRKRTGVGPKRRIRRNNSAARAHKVIRPLPTKSIGGRTPARRNWARSAFSTEASLDGRAVIGTGSSDER
jgi:hypothetical protein